MMYENKSKDQIIEAMIKIADQYERQALIPQDQTQYQLRMRSILQSAIYAAKEMDKIRKNCIIFTNNAYLISFHALMQDSNFATKHKAFFPSKISDNYHYGIAEFTEFDAATCLAAALYNFYLWIPDNINNLPENERIRCLTNAITSAIVTGGNSDSIASVTGQLCGAYVSQLSLPECLPNNIESYSAMRLLIKAI